MADSHFPELSDRDLLAYLDGEASPSIVQHVSGCTACQERARELAAVEGRLAHRLHRATCPTPQALGEYHLGLLPEPRAATVRQHLAACLHCDRELGEMRAYLAQVAPDVAMGPLACLRTIIARLVSGANALLGPDLALAPAANGLRGAASGPRVYEAEDTQLVIDVTPDSQRPGTIQLLGLALGGDVVGMQAELRRDETLVDAAQVDALGNFCLSASRGSHRLSLRGTDREIRIESLDI